jgi:hypothetical protein
MAYMVGGFFGFIGRAIKKVARVVGKIGGTALGVASTLMPGPAGRLVGGIGGRLAGLNSAYRRVQAARGLLSRHDMRARPPGLLQKISPIMPGGSVATYGRGIPPILRGYGPTRRRRRKSSSSRRRASSGRKLKFGSPAWRKKYMKRRRRAA